MSDKQVSLTIDGREITVPDGTLVIRAAELLGIYVPRFCDHPYLKPLGACRQCLVEVEGQRKPLTSCTTTCTDGMVVKTQATSDIARDGQEGVLELLLINHPLDCPMCDKGGECPLQDQTLAYGPGGSRMLDQKRRYQKPVPVNNLVYLDRERCVLCARCTRFASEISGDPFIELFERGSLEQVAIFEDDPYESNFSGNVIQICPVGALTSKQFRFVARPFDMTSTFSTCTQCASGCAITIQERRDSIVRVLAADDPAVNDVWSCDKGRFAFRYVGDEVRVTEPMVRKGGELVAVSWAEAVRVAADRIRTARAEQAPIGVLTGGNLLNEDAYALSRFARLVLETNDIAITAGVWNAETDAMWAQMPGLPQATYESIDAATLIVVAGADLYEESPIAFLRVRKAASRGAHVVEVSARRGKLPGTAVVVAPDALAAGVASIKAAVEAAGPGAVILAGERLAASPGALSEAWNLALSAGASFGFVPRKAGIRGAVDAGLRPAIVPPGGDAAWSAIVPQQGRSARDILQQMTRGEGVVLLAGADPAGDFDDTALAARAFAGGSTLIALDMFLNASTAMAEVILPVSAAPERDGTISTWEGRARDVRRAVDPAGLSVPDWEALSRLAGELDAPFPRTLAEVRAEIGRLGARGADAAPIAGAAETLRDGRTAELPLALVTYRLLLDRGNLMTGAAELSGVMTAPFVEINPKDAGASGIADGDHVRVTGASGSVVMPARVTDAVAAGVVFVPLDQPGASARDIADLTAHVPGVRVEKA